MLLNYKVETLNTMQIGWRKKDFDMRFIFLNLCFKCVMCLVCEKFDQNFGFQSQNHICYELINHYT